MAGVWGRTLGALEAGANLASGAVAEPVAGWAGIVAGGDADAVKKAREALTYAPKTPQGRQAVAGIGEIMGKLKDAAMASPLGSVVNGFNDVADRAGEASPALGAAVKTAPAALAMLFGPGGSATRSAVGNVARGTAQGVERAAITAAENAAAVPAMRGPMAHEKGIFAGHLSKEAPIWKLEQAKTMQALGKSDKEIYAHTGWFAGSADGKWRYEIPDNEARLTDRAADVQAYADDNTLMRANEALNHPELNAAYPDVMHDTGVMFADRNMGGARGSYTDGLISIDRDIGDRSTLLHELQHAVQDKEGFATGGSPFDATLPTNTKLAEEVNAEYRAQMDAVRNSPDYQALVQKYAAELPMKTSRRSGDQIPDLSGAALRADGDLLADIEQQRLAAIQPYMTDDLTGRDVAYRRLAGEAEARLVQSRMHMTPQERAASYPPDMYDIPVEQQIVRYGSGRNDMIKTEFGQIPETEAEIEKMADTLARQGERAGYTVDSGASNVSGSRYVTFKRPEMDDVQIRISNHGDRYPNQFIGDRFSVDPESGQTFEVARQWLKDSGINLDKRKKVSKEVIDDATLEKILGIPIAQMKPEFLERLRRRYVKMPQGYWAEKD